MNDVLKDKSILISGGTGFFGNAFVKEAMKQDCPRICIYSRGEHRQADMRSELGDPGSCRWFIGDVRDPDRLELAMHDVDIVVHAAALKRIEVCHHDPIEAVATNVQGTANVIMSCLRTGVKKLVLVSSDKACEPTTLYGATKATAEQLVLAANSYARTRCAVVRYGNIWGSTGSVVPTWRKLAQQGPVPITDPRCTRFFMRIEEAVNLVMECIETMPSEIMTPDLPAYLITDLATAMNVQTRVVGLNGGEKRHERMVEGDLDSSQVRRISVEELRCELSKI